MRKNKIFIILCLMPLILIACNQKESMQDDNDKAEIYSDEEENGIGDHAFYYYEDFISHLGINRDDDYESVISKLGAPYYENTESIQPSVAYLVKDRIYVVIFFNEETGNVFYISSFKE